ncbi:MAG: hypothetical protein LC792_03325 [Actinobacteria bacterium]|nr:hypothetical protein [Actinomycetota bacterium]
MGAGFADFTLIACHFEHAAVISPGVTPVSYAIAMAVSGAGSLAFGRAFDRGGPRGPRPAPGRHRIVHVVAWFLGSWAMGVLYGRWRPGLVAFATAGRAWATGWQRGTVAGAAMGLAVERL